MYRLFVKERAFSLVFFSTFSGFAGGCLLIRWNVLSDNIYIDEENGNKESIHKDIRMSDECA